MDRESSRYGWYVLMKPIPYGRQSISSEDIDAVLDVLRSDYLTQGPLVPEFERAVAAYCGSRYAIAVNSATSALHLACLALGVKSGDIVWTSPVTFVASANCAIYCGASVDFIDIDFHTYNISIKALSEKLRLAEKQGKLPKVLVAVHFSGQSCEMAEIKGLGEKYGFKIIEDASHAIGGRYKDNLIGGCQYSDITVFSFHPVKIITTGEGGILTTNDMNLADKISLYRSHGITNAESNMALESEDEIWNYQQIDLGFNYRMTDLQAALGLSQLKKIDEFVNKRHQLAACYDEKLANLPITIPYQIDDAYSSYHLYVIRFKFDEFNKAKSQREIYQEFKKVGVLANLHYIPVYRQPYYKRMGFSKGYCPEAELYFKEALTIPLYPDLTKSQQNYVINQLERIICE